MMKKRALCTPLILLLSLILIADLCPAQSCTNWLKTTNQFDDVSIGDLDISGNQLTIEATFNRTATYVGGRLYAGDIVSKHNGPSDCNYLLRPSSAEITTTNGYYITPVICDIQLNKTYHVAMTYDGSTLKFYRNGFLMSQVAASGTLILNNWLTRIGDVGSGLPGPAENLVGYINEVRIWNVARSQADIRTYMNTSLPAPTTQTGLLAYYTFDNLINKQGNATWNGSLVNGAQINQTNTSCTFTADSCNIKVTPVVPTFSTPDTVCVGTPLNITNTTTGATSYYWNFCVADLNTPPTGANLGNIGNNLSTPVFMDYVNVNGNYYGFLINHSPGGLVRLDFGNSLLNTPTSTNLGNFGGILPPASGSEGIQMVQNGGNWYAIIVADATVGGGSPRLIKVDFGTNILNATPTATNWGNIGNMLQPIDLHVFNENNNWYGFTANAVNNTITRFNFGTNFNIPPTGINLGNVGNLNYPTGIYAINDNGNWRVFVTNAGTPASLTRLDFGSSLLNTPTATNLGNPNNGLYHTRDFTLMKFCGQIIGFAVNGDNSYGEIVKLDFHNDLTSTPTITSLGNIGNVSFPHSLSKLFRVNDNVYSFITNAANNTITRLQFAGCTNASTSSSTLQYPPAVTYNTPGTYNINLTVDDGLATQASLCKQVVVLPALTHAPTQNITLCSGDSIKIGTKVPFAVYSWNTGAATDSIVVKAAGSYWVQTDRYGCSNRDSFIVATAASPMVNLGADTILCKPANVLLDAGNPGATYLWQDGSGAQTFTATTTGKFYVQVTNSNGCKASDTINISQASTQAVNFSYQQNVCNPLAVQFTGTGTNLQNLYWAFGDGNTTTGNLSPAYTYAGYGNYTVRFGYQIGSCKDTITQTVPVTVTKSDIIVTPDTTICFNSNKQLRTRPALSFCWSPATYLDNPNSPNPVTSTPTTITYYFNAQVPGTNLITNGDFSSGSTGITSDYTLANPNTTEGQYFVGANPQAWNGLLATCHDHTTGNGNMMMVNGAPQANKVIWSQTVNVTPNTNYAFSTWLQNLNVNNTSSNPPRLQFSINGNVIGNIFQATYASCVWDQFYSVWNSGTATTVTISIVNQNTVVSGNDFALDDISFAPIAVLRDSVTITVDSPFVKTNNDTTICKNGSVQLTTTGAANIGAWSWLPGTGLSNSAISNPVATPGGNTEYIVTGTTPNGCVAKDTVTIKIDSVLADFHYKQDVCNPLSVQFTGDGSSTVNPYWAFGDGNTITATTSPAHTYAGYSIYTVKYAVQTAGGCKDTVTKLIPITITKGDMIVTPDTTICLNATKQLRAQPGALSYCWTPATYLDDPASITPVTSTPATTTYYLNAEVQGNNLITNGDFSNGNTNFTTQYSYTQYNTTEGQYYVGTNPQLFNGSMSACSDHTTGTGNMMIVNGSPTANEIVWSTTVNVTPNSNYAFSTWVEALGTRNPAQLSFSINGTVIGATFTPSLPSCTWTQFYETWNSGANTTATISIINRNQVLVGNDFALDDITFTPINIIHDSIVVSVDTPRVITNNDTTICKGTSVQLVATGTGSSNTWLWTPAGGLSNTNTSNPIATPAGNTQYIVTGTNNNGCVGKDTVAITWFADPVIITDHNLIACPNSAVQLMASSGMQTYQWSPAAALNNPAIYNPVVGSATNAVYTVQGKDANSCSYADSVTVSLKTFQFAASPNDSICEGGSIKLMASGGDTYQWSPAGSLNDATSATPVASPGTNTVYTVHITENTCLHDTTISMEIAIRPVPLITAQKTNDINCTTPTAKLSASGGVSYVWSPVTGLDNATIPNPVAGADTTITYYVTGTNEHGCTGTASITVYASTEGKVTFMVPNAFTPNGDGRNDCFGVKTWGSAVLQEFSIYNRWGQRVFSSTSPSACWDGRFNGQLMDTGTFVYVIRAKTMCGEIKRTGTVVLIR
jgi:gliding motility-associated-like protein